MANYTDNLKLFKPGTDDDVGVEASLEENFIKIDKNLGDMLKDLDGKTWESAGARVNDYQRSLKTSQGDITKLKKRSPNARLDTHFFRIIANRGAKAVAPENTLMAYAYAVDMGYFGIEALIQLTSDGKWVCYHYADIKERSNGSGTVASKTLAQLKTLDFGSWYSVVYKDERIPTVEELLEICRLGEVVAYLDINIECTDVQIEALIELIRDYDMEDAVVIMSQSYNNLKKVRYYSDYLALGYTRTSAFTQKDVTDTQELGNAFINANKDLITKSSMKMANKARLSVEAYNVMTNNELRKLLRLGIRGAQTHEIPFGRGY